MRIKSEPSESKRDTSYRGYMLKVSPFDGLVRVSKDGFVIFTAETIEAARRAVDEVTA